MARRAIQLDKIKRPGGVFEFDMYVADETEAVNLRAGADVGGA